MAHIPGGLWRPSARDLAGLNVRWHFDRQTPQAALTTISASFAVPQDQVLILQRIQLDLTPGAGQNAVASTIYLLTPVTLQIVAAIDVQMFAPAGRQLVNVGLDDIWLPPSSVLYMAGVFDNNVNANQLSANSLGVLIPRGNFPSI